MKNTSQIAGYVTFTLHSHLPYVVNHGTWPHGLDWLNEAAAETYLPLLRVLEDLESRGVALKANVNLSPVLLEQLDHPTFKSAFPKYLQQKIVTARLDQREWAEKNEHHFVEVAKYWERFYTDAARHFEELNGDIITAFRHFYERGAIEIITCGATHGYFALLGSDASIRAQVRMGVETHKRFFGRAPKGIWLPECAYRPEGEWNFPVSSNGSSGLPSFKRAGVEQILAENGIQFFFIDTHLVESRALFTPYPMLAGDVPIASELGGDARASYYRPYFAGIPRSGLSGVAFFTRDPRTGLQVWSGEIGYPGDGVYLDFHKKRWPGGHRYWQVTHSKADLADKTAYFPERALARTADHARHFAQLAKNVLDREPKNGGGAPPILTAPFDAELFGHWWFEGPEWLRHVAIELGRPESPVKLTTCSEYLDRYSASGYLNLPEGSWGRNGTHEVWLNPDTEWTWKHIYSAEQAVLQMSQGGRWRESDLARRLGNQLCRELLLLESSDWQFLITTAHARDYAEKRFNTHLDQLNSLLTAWQQYESTGAIDSESARALETIEKRDSIFPSITPEVYL